MEGSEVITQDEKQVENDVSSEEEIDTVANIIHSAILSNKENTVAQNSNVRKGMNEDLIVLYDGLLLDTTKMGQVELKYIDNSSHDKDKYVITYYNYENFQFVNSTLGKLSEPIYENGVGIENVSKIAISENYPAITGEIKVINTLPSLILENNKIDEYDLQKTIITDLDSNGTNEYIAILANQNTGYSKIALYDSTGKLVSDLAYLEKDKWNPNAGEYYLSLEHVNIIDVNNDNIMEILVELPKYEGNPSVSIVQYQNSECMGDTNIACSLLP